VLLGPHQWVAIREHEDSEIYREERTLLVNLHASRWSNKNTLFTLFESETTFR
jgi:hypothetical protein